MKYKPDVYLITCLTNMHVGSGEANYGVQRDPVTEIPIIHSSSLKGALREHFKNEWGKDDARLDYVFGADPMRKKDGDKKGAQIGYYKFFDANLIVLPVRSSANPFYRATTEFVLNEVNERAAALGLAFNISPLKSTNTVEKDKPKIISSNGNIMLEDYEALPGLELKDSTNFLGDNLALFHEDTFKELSKRLPVIARNQLENGQSKNLWYEEVVPRESRFIFFVSKSNDTSIVSHEEFDGIIVNDIVQIGGNASIGYGYSKITKLS